MSLASVISSNLKKLTFDTTATRQMRALYVAQVLAYRVPLVAGDTWAEVEAVRGNEFTALLNEVNELVVVDIKLARAYFQRVVIARLEVLQSPVDPVLAAFILRSDTQLDNLNPEDRQVFVSFMASADYVGSIRELSDVAVGEWAPVAGAE